MPRRNRAAARSTRRKGTERRIAVAREGGRLLNGHCAAARGKPRGLANSRACRWQQAVARGLVRDRGAIRYRAPVRGSARGRRAEGLAGPISRGTPRTPHATAREYAPKGSYRNSLRDPNDLRGRERSHRPEGGRDRDRDAPRTRPCSGLGRRRRWSPGRSAASPTMACKRRRSSLAGTLQPKGPELFSDIRPLSRPLGRNALSRA